MKKSLLFVLVACIMAAFTSCEKEPTALMPEDINNVSSIEGYVYYPEIDSDGSSLGMKLLQTKATVTVFASIGPKSVVTLQVPVKGGKFQAAVPVPTSDYSDLFVQCEFQTNNYDKNLNTGDYEAATVLYKVDWSGPIIWGETKVLQLIGKRAGVVDKPYHEGEKASLPK